MAFSDPPNVTLVWSATTLEEEKLSLFLLSKNRDYHSCWSLSCFLHEVLFWNEFRTIGCWWLWSRLLYALIEAVIKKTKATMDMSLDFWWTDFTRKQSYSNWWTARRFSWSTKDVIPAFMAGKSSILYYFIFIPKNYSMTTYAFRRYSSKLHRREWHGFPSSCGLQPLSLNWYPSGLMVCLQAFSKLLTTAYMGLSVALHYFRSFYKRKLLKLQQKPRVELWCDIWTQLWQTMRTKSIHVDMMIRWEERLSRPVSNMRSEENEGPVAIVLWGASRNV